jgi:SET domain-containing protein
MDQGHRVRKNQKYPPTDWIDPRIEIRASPIHGQGMFAKAPIQPGETVTIWGGTVLLTEDDLAANRANSYIWATIGEGLYLARLIREEAEDLANYLNHACDPNVWLQDEITLVTRREIASGEELTIDYALFEGDENWVGPWACQCGAENCRGVYTGRDWREKELQERYGNHFSPFICERIRKLRIQHDAD